MPEPIQNTQPDERRVGELVREHLLEIRSRTDRMFIVLLITQWIAGIGLALWVSPLSWAGATSGLHVHLVAAIVLGGLISLVPVAIALRRPGTALSRHCIAAGQALSSALLIHLSGGRIETHFHIFGSLAFLASYRDWRVLMTASAITAVDHCVRGIFYPQSVFGVLAASNLRWLEHAGWVVFTDIFLLHSCFRARGEIIGLARRQATLEATKNVIESEVERRTLELRDANVELEREVAERARAEEERTRLGEQLHSAQKLEAVGQLAAGIAHEINTPTQYVGDNTRFLEDAFGDLAPVLDQAKALAAAVDESSEASPQARELEAALSDADVEFLATEVPKAIAQSLDGIGRVSKIVRAMKEFSHPGAEGMSDSDLNAAIESTVTVASNEWKYVADVVTEFDQDLPHVHCSLGEFNQVVLNMVVNASHAIADRVGIGGTEKGEIRIATRQDGDHVEVRVSDTGAGIAEENLSRVFDPFFTTKDVGKGTGQGLSLAHSVIVGKHSGTLDVESELGQGTTFIIRLPIAQPQLESAA